jgi:ABC-2 type transport system permease protein
MPIHSDGYRPYLGTRHAHGRAWLVITAAGVRAVFSNRRLLGLLLVAWIPFVVRAVQIYAATNFPQAPFLQISPKMFHDFLRQQGLFVFFITVWVGSGLIANDRRSNALQIYFSKPVTRADYVGGKLGILVCFLLLVTWVPSMLLLVVQAALAGDLRFLAANTFVVPAITIAALVPVLMSSLTILALSSFSKSARFVAITYAGLVFFSEAVFNVVRATTRRTTMSWLSPPATVNQIGDAVFGLRPSFETPIAVSLAAMAVLMAMSLLVLAKRVRAVEVVA